MYLLGKYYKKKFENTKFYEEPKTTLTTLSKSDKNSIASSEAFMLGMIDFETDKTDLKFTELFLPKWKDFVYKEDVKTPLP